jgi:hypothetical protein
VIVDYPDEIAFDTVPMHVMALLRFLEIIVGRRQNLTECWIGVRDGDAVMQMTVNWSYPPSRDRDVSSRDPDTHDILCDAVREPEIFGAITTRWIERDHAWRPARQRFSASFSRQSNYPHDRLIAAANMFDILPDEAVPVSIDLPEQVANAKDWSTLIFESLSNSPERNSILSALGRLGKPVLKQKVRHRAKLITDLVGDLFPELWMVTDEAVNCRNYYVHGGKPRLDYAAEFQIFAFLTDTLEFVFGASDFVEAGWDIKSWSRRATSASHPFASYRIDYDMNLAALKAKLPQAKN